MSNREDDAVGQGTGRPVLRWLLRLLEVWIVVWDVIGLAIGFSLGANVIFEVVTGAMSMVGLLVAVGAAALAAWFARDLVRGVRALGRPVPGEY